MSVLAYLASIFGHTHGVQGQLRQILKNQERIMATLADFQAKFDAITTSVGTIADSQTSVSESLANIAADIQRLKDQIGGGTPGLTEEEAQAALATLDTISASLTSAATTVEANAQALRDVAAIVPE